MGSVVKGEHLKIKKDHSNGTKIYFIKEVLTFILMIQIWIKIKAFYDYEIQMEASPPLLGRRSCQMRNWN